MLRSRRWPLDAGDHAGGDPRVARRRLQFVVTQQRLDNSNIGAALEQVGREAVAQRVQRHGLFDPGRATDEMVRSVTRCFLTALIFFMPLAIVRPPLLNGPVAGPRFNIADRTIR
jgi:hypothetical protein